MDDALSFDTNLDCMRLISERIAMKNAHTIVVYLLLALGLHAESPAWTFKIDTDPISDEKSAIIHGSEENSEYGEKVELSILVHSNSCMIFADIPEKVPYRRIEAPMRFDDNPAETIPWAPEDGMLFCLRNGGEMLSKFVNANRLVFRVPLEDHSQRTAIFNLSGFRSAWSNVVEQVFPSATDAEKLLNASWQLKGDHANQWSQDWSWSPAAGACSSVITVYAESDGSARLYISPGVCLGTKGNLVKLPIRLDDGVWSKGDFIIVDDRGTMLCYAHNATPVIKKMLQASKLEAKIHPLVGDSFVTAFSLVGLGPTLKNVKPKP